MLYVRIGGDPGRDHLELPVVHFPECRRQPRLLLVEGVLHAPLKRSDLRLEEPELEQPKDRKQREGNERQLPLEQLANEASGQSVLSHQRALRSAGYRSQSNASYRTGAMVQPSVLALPTSEAHFTAREIDHVRC